MKLPSGQLPSGQLTSGQHRLLVGQTPRVVAVVRLAWADTGSGPSVEQLREALGWDSQQGNWAIAELHRQGVLISSGEPNSLRVAERESSRWGNYGSQSAVCGQYRESREESNRSLGGAFGRTFRPGDTPQSLGRPEPESGARLHSKRHIRQPNRQRPIRRRRLLSDVLR